jgi:hypothetical protein
MFIEPDRRESFKLRRSAIFSFSQHNYAPTELKSSSCYVSYKHLAALRPGQKSMFDFQQHTITPPLTMEETNRPIWSAATCRRF